MREPCKKHWPDLVPHEAHGVGSRRVIFSEEDPVTKNLQAMTHGIMKPHSILADFFLHPDKDEIIHVVRGQGLIHFRNREPMQIEAGDVVCIPAGVELRLENPTDQELEAFFVRVYDTPNDLTQ